MGHSYTSRVYVSSIETERSLTEDGTSPAGSGGAVGCSSGQITTAHNTCVPFTARLSRITTAYFSRYYGFASIGGFVS
jgi:hypothetical protein